MIRSLLRCIRLGMAAEKIVLAYKAIGYTEEEALGEWGRTLHEAVSGERRATLERLTGMEGGLKAHSRLVRDFLRTEGGPYRGN